MTITKTNFNLKIEYLAASMVPVQNPAPEAGDHHAGYLPLRKIDQGVIVEILRLEE